MKKRIAEQAMSLFFLLVGVAAIIIIQAQKTSAMRVTGATTFKSFPTFCGILIVSLSAISLFTSIVKGIAEDKANAGALKFTEGEVSMEVPAQKRLIAIRVICMFLMTLAFALLLKKVHFFLLVSVYLFLSFLLLGRNKILQNLAVSVGGTGIIYVVFVTLLKLSL